jgi:hypothetical protein
MTIPERRLAISEVIECAFVWPGGGEVHNRIHVFLRGRGPVGLPAIAERRARLPPFDPTGLPPSAPPTPLPEVDLDELRTQLQEFTVDKQSWPSFPEFQEAGLAHLHDRAQRHGGGLRWAHELELPFIRRAPDGSVWTDDKVRAALSAALEGKTVWPTWKEFKDADYESLRRAVAANGGPERWAKEMGVHLPAKRRGVNRPWTYARRKAEIASLAGPDNHWPTQVQFRAAGLEGLHQIIIKRGMRGRIIADLGLTARAVRKQRTRHWTPEKIRAELDRFLDGRDRWPTAKEFAAAGLGGLRTHMSKRDMDDWWAAQYGMTVRRRP